MIFTRDFSRSLLHTYATIFLYVFLFGGGEVTPSLSCLQSIYLINNKLESIVVWLSRCIFGSTVPIVLYLMRARIHANDCNRNSGFCATKQYVKMHHIPIRM